MLDLILLLYIGWRFQRGLGSTIQHEINALVYRLLLLASLSGFFLLWQVGGLIRSALEQIAGEPGFSLTLLSLLLASLLVFQFRQKISLLLEQRIAQTHQPLASGLLATLRGVLMASLFVLFLRTAPFDLFDKLLTDSYFYRFLELLLSAV